MPATPRQVLITVVSALAAATAVLIAAPMAHADGGSLRNWTGSGDGHSWTDPGNWDSGVPMDGDSVVIAPQAGGCATHVDDVPTITLQDFTLTIGSGCGTSISGGSITVDGLLSWDEGSLGTPVTLAPGATGTISGSAAANDKVLAADLTVQGSLELSDVSGPGALEIVDPHVLHVVAGGVLHTSGNDVVDYEACCANPARITNDGTLAVDDGALAIESVALDQHGSMSVAAGAVATLTGPGLLGPGSYTGRGRLVLGGGHSAVLAGRNTLGNGFRLELAAGTLAGTGTIAGRGSFDWSGGSLSARTTVAEGGTLHAYGAATHGLSGTITDHGTVTVDFQASVLMSGPTTLRVAADGTLSLAPGTSFTSVSCCAAPNRIVNDGGTVTVPAASAGVAPGTPATLAGDAYDAIGGTTSVAAGEVLALTGGPLGSLQHTTVSGAGRVQIATPTTLSGTSTIAAGSHLALVPSGTLDGNGTLAGPGEVDWTGGTMSGTPTVAVAGGLDASGTTAKVVAQNATVHVTGPMTVESGTADNPTVFSMIYSPAAVILSGTTTIGHDVLVHGGGWTNDGALTVAAGAGGPAAFDQNARLVNTGTAQIASGTLSVGSGYQQSAGSTLVLSTGTLAASVVVAGGELAGTGTVNGSVRNDAGTVAPGTLATGSRGTLAVTGTYTQNPGGRLAIDVAGPGASERDVLAVGGAATLAGALTTTSRAGYVPPAGTDLPVLTTTSRSGTFECAFSDHLAGTRWLPVYSASTVDVAPGANGASGCLAYRPIAPARGPSTFSVGFVHPTVVDLRGLAGVTASTPAVTVNLSVDNTTATGALLVAPRNVAPTATAVRFARGVPASGQVTVALQAGRLQLQTTRGRADVQVDVLGLFADGQGGSGSLVHPQQPAALPATTVSSGGDVLVQIGGRAGVPLSGVTAVTATVTVRSATADGLLAVLPGGSDYAGTESVAVRSGQVTDNLVTSAVDASGRLQLHLSAGSARVVVTVLAWYGDDGTGSWTVPVAPSVVSTTVVSTTPAIAYVVGVGNVPSSGVTSVLVSVDVTAPSRSAALQLGGRGAILWPVVHFPRAGVAGSAQLVPGMFNEAAEQLTAGSATVALAVFGYTVG